MNKAELVEALAKKTGLSKADTIRCLNALFSTSPREGIIASEVAKGEKVQITGFGAWESRKRNKRQGRNPKTGETITIPGGNYPAFTAGKSFKDRLK